MLGAEHLLTGIDHILFLLALIAGSRRLREIVLAATSFTLAHSVTFVLAALGLVDVPARVVEPDHRAVDRGGRRLAPVAALAARRPRQRPRDGGTGHFSLDRAGWTRLGVVFCFGLVHGLGFAGALGIDEAWSWTLLWSLLVFNVGIETVQLAIIAAGLPAADAAAAPCAEGRSVGDRALSLPACPLWVSSGSFSGCSGSEGRRRVFRENATNRMIQVHRRVHHAGEASARCFSAIRESIFTVSTRERKNGTR